MIFEVVVAGVIVCVHAAEGFVGGQDVQVLELGSVVLAQISNWIVD